MTDSTHVLAFKRKREGRTNYKRRLALLKSARPRLVVRASNKFIQAQIVRYEPDGDIVVAGLTSKALGKHGVTGGLNSTPAAYLTGVMLGKLAREKGVASAVADLGLQKHHAGGRLSAVIKGANDGGLTVPAAQESLPAPDRLGGAHLKAELQAQFAHAANALGVKLSAERVHKEKPAKAEKSDKSEKGQKGDKPAKAAPADKPAKKAKAE